MHRLIAQEKLLCKEVSRFIFSLLLLALPLSFSLPLTAVLLSARMQSPNGSDGARDWQNLERLRWIFIKFETAKKKLHSATRAKAKKKSR